MMFAVERGQLEAHVLASRVNESPSSRARQPCAHVHQHLQLIQKSHRHIIDVTSLQSTTSESPRIFGELL